MKNPSKSSSSPSKSAFPAISRHFLLLFLLLVRGAYGLQANHTQVLLDLYEGLNGASWAARCQWDLSDADYCGWNRKVVICDRNVPGEIFELQLAGCGINGTVPSSFSQLKRLQRLRLNSKHVVSGVPKVDSSRFVDLSKVGNFTGSDLRILSLDRTDFGPTIPACFQGMTKLNTLVISRSKLQGESVMDDLMHLKKLRLFHIYQNDIASTVPTQIGSLRVLSVFNAFANRLHGQLPTQIGKATALELIDLTKNDLHGSLPSQVGQLSDLAQLWMRDNPRLGGKLPETLGRLSNLLSLRLENASFTGMVPVELRQMSSLQELKLGNNQLTSIPVTEWSLLIESLTWTVPSPHKCENETYDLREHRNDRFRNIYLEQHPSPYLQNLATLDLSRNKISMEADDVIRSVSGLLSLVSIDISHNDLHGDRQLELLITDAFVFGSPRLMIADLDLPCKDQRVDFARHNQRKVLQIVTDLNMAGNPRIAAPNMSERITFGQMNLKNLNISGNVGFTGELWRNAHKIQTFDATGTGFTRIPSNVAVNRGEEISRREEVTCFAYEWTAAFARDRVVLVDSSIDQYRNCFCNDNFQNNRRNGDQCVTCPSGQVTPAITVIGQRSEMNGNRNHTCVKCKPGTYRGFTKSGAAICLGCPQGEVQPLPGESSCDPCPSGSMPDTTQTSCHAKTGFWKWPTESEGPSSMDPEDNFFQCFAIVDENGATPCTGANTSNIDPVLAVTNFTSAGCLPGTDGTLCLSCAPHFTKLQSFNPFSPCVPCNAAQVAISALVIAAIIAMTVGIVVVAICTQEHRNRHRMRAALHKSTSASQHARAATENERASGIRCESKSVRDECEEEGVVAAAQSSSIYRQQEREKTTTSTVETNGNEATLKPNDTKHVDEADDLAQPRAEAFCVVEQSAEEQPQPQATTSMRRRHAAITAKQTKGASDEAEDLLHSQGQGQGRGQGQVHIGESESGSGLRSSFKVMLSYFQITSSIALLPLPWSVDELWLFGISDSLGVSSLSIECLFDSSDPDVRLHVGRATFTLILVPLAVALTACVVAIVEKQAKGMWWSKRCTQRQTIATIALAVTSHYLCTRSGLELLSCLDQDAKKKRFPDQSFLRLDPQFPCPIKAEGGLEIGLAMALLIIYGCGIPLVSYIGIRMDAARGWDVDLERDVGSEEDQAYIVKRFQYLYEDYKPQYRNWELRIIFRKSLFLAIAMLLRTPSGEIEIACAQLVLFASALAQALCMPFRLDYVNRLDIASLAVSMVTIVVGIVLRSDRITPLEATYITVITGMGNLLFAFGVLTKVFYEVSSRRDQLPHFAERGIRLGCLSSPRGETDSCTNSNRSSSSRKRVAKVQAPRKRAEVAQT